MKITELDSTFRAMRQRFVNLGLVETRAGEYSREFEKPNEFTLEFVSERYDPDINVLISGPFSKGEQLVLGILANAVDPKEAEDVRVNDGLRNANRIVGGVLRFLETHARVLIANPEKYLLAYTQAIQDLRSRHGLDSSP